MKNHMVYKKDRGKLAISLIAASLCALVMVTQPSFGIDEREADRGKTFFKADLQWKFYDLLDKFDKHFKLPRMKIENGTPDRYDRVEVEKNVPIPMRDGLKLYANVYRPKAEGKFPVILTRLPYGKDEYYCWMPVIGKFWAKKGYVFVAQDVRGKFCSEGEFEPLINEVEDGYDTLDWIAAQPWCDGAIGMEGESYYGYTTWAGAVGGHPNLKCISPMNTAMDFHDLMFQNGALTLQTAGLYPILMHGKTYQNVMRLDRMHLPLITIDDAAGIPTPSYDRLLEHPLRDEVTEVYNLHNRRERVEIPILAVAGWYDVFLKTAISDWLLQRQENMRTEAKDRQWLLVCPIDHESTPIDTKRIGRLDIGDKFANTIWEVRQAFYDKYLKGIDNGFEKTAPVRIFVIGDNDWRYENEWPLARTQYTDYYLHSAGSANTLGGDGDLSLNAPTDEPFDTYVYDPEDPVKIHYDIDLWALAGEMKDRHTAEKRQDVLVYTSAPLEKDMEITGPISVTLYASSSAVDTDFTAALVDVFPARSAFPHGRTKGNSSPAHPVLPLSQRGNRNKGDFSSGYLHLIQEGIQRASFRGYDMASTAHSVLPLSQRGIKGDFPQELTPIPLASDNSDSSSRPSYLEPEKIYEYNIDLWATSHVFKAGHKIRVEISSSNFDRFDRNLNTGAPFAMTSETATATQKIYHTAQYPSRITLPVIPR